jgi:hypothetical protein
MYNTSIVNKKETEMAKVDFTLRTGGNGYWSNRVANVRITAIVLCYVNEDEQFGSVNAGFDTDTWNVETDGLVYTDKTFIEAFRVILIEMGLDTSDLSYSEQGMQDVNFINFDVGSAFIASFKTAFPEEFAETVTNCA